MENWRRVALMASGVTLLVAGSVLFWAVSGPNDVQHTYLVWATAPVTLMAFIASVALVEGFYRRDR